MNAGTSESYHLLERFQSVAFRPTRKIPTQKRGNAEGPRRGPLRLCVSASLRLCVSASLRLCVSASLRLCVSASLCSLPLLPPSLPGQFPSLSVGLCHFPSILIIDFSTPSPSPQKTYAETTPKHTIFAPPPSVNSVVNTLGRITKRTHQLPILP